VIVEEVHNLLQPPIQLLVLTPAIPLSVVQAPLQGLEFIYQIKTEIGLLGQTLLRLSLVNPNHLAKDLNCGLGMIILVIIALPNIHKVEVDIEVDMRKSTKTTLQRNRKLVRDIIHVIIILVIVVIAVLLTHNDVRRTRHTHNDVRKIRDGSHHYFVVLQNL